MGRFWRPAPAPIVVTEWQVSVTAATKPSPAGLAYGERQFDLSPHSSLVLISGGRLDLTRLDWLPGTLYTPRIANGDWHASASVALPADPSCDPALIVNSPASTPI